MIPCFPGLRVFVMTLEVLCQVVWTRRRFPQFIATPHSLLQKAQYVTSFPTAKPRNIVLTLGRDSAVSLGGCGKVLSGSHRRLTEILPSVRGSQLDSIHACDVSAPGHCESAHIHWLGPLPEELSSPSIPV